MNGPMLDKVKGSFANILDRERYPFCVPIIKNWQDIYLPTPVTCFVGENGTGKSTLIEAMAYNVGFGLEGGSKNIHFTTAEDEIHQGAKDLAQCITLSWRHKPMSGYFFRAESFFNVASYLDRLGGNAYASYGGKSLHEQSHGESFLSFFKHRLERGGFFILDEPEAALSPQRQLALLFIMHKLCATTQSQFLIATHSPILLAYPGATIYSCDGEALESIAYKDTDHYKLTKQFLDDPQRYLQYLFEGDE